MAQATGGGDGVHQPLTLAYLNVQGGLGDKRHALLAFLQQRQPDILCLGETWLTEHGGGFDLVGYKSFHCVRPRCEGARGRPSGGVSIFVKHSFAGGPLHIRADAVAGIVWIDFPTWHLTVAACYFSPHDSPFHA